MASEIVRVLKNKNKYEKEAKEQQKIDITRLNNEGKFRVALNKGVEELRILMQDEGVDYAEIHVEEENLALFNNALYFEELKEFAITQLSANDFKVERIVVL